MITQTISVNECSPQTIVIGRRGTYDTMQIAFNLAYLIENYGNGTAVLAVKRSQDETAYPAVTTQDETTLTWVISDVDTAYKGSGECEIFWYVDDALAKTVIYPLTILRDIGETTEEPPDGYQNWVDSLTALGAETQENARKSAESEANAKESETNAKTSEENAKASEEAAAKSEAKADSHALESEGFAVGEQDGEPVTPGSPYYQNNAKYYAGVAQQGAEEAGYVWFDVNDQDGEMYVTITPNLDEDVTFKVDEATGILEVTING